MYRFSNLRCDFHRTNTSQRGQDVVATPCTTTVIYTHRAQAETDVHFFFFFIKWTSAGRRLSGNRNFLWDCTFLGWMAWGGGVYFRLRLACSKGFRNRKQNVISRFGQRKGPVQDFIQRERRDWDQKPVKNELGSAVFAKTPPVRSVYEWHLSVTRKKNYLC